MTYPAGRHFLQIPGPTNVPDRVLRAIDRATIDHRGPEFQKLGQEVLTGLKAVFKTKSPVVIFPASGTGAWEAALVNTLSPGDRVLMYETGHFATLWHRMAQRLALNPEFIASDWRRGADPAALEGRLTQDRAHEIKAVCVVHNETSIDYRHDEWGVDVTVAGSQKGLMLPPGLSFNAVSDKALAATKSAKLPSSYWSWEEMLGPNKSGFFPYTPATNLLYGLREALRMLVEEEGLENVFKRHDRHAEATRRAVRAWGLEILCLNPAEYSSALTAVLMPNGYSEVDFRKVVLERFNMSLGSGLGKLAQKVFRIGHLGDFNDLTLLGTLAGVEMGLTLSAVPHKAGGVAAAMDYLTKATAPVNAGAVLEKV
jgi:alanine-glyoxylate transaminase/serine-glyoxylate transaminase/serine-pyruvate transaminase